MKSISAFRRACTAAIIAAVQVFLVIHGSATIIAVQSGVYFSKNFLNDAVQTFPIDLDENGEVDFALYTVNSEVGAYALGSGSGVFGVRFIGNDGLYHYGWIDLKLESSSSMTIYGWAYETEPGVFVTPYAIPEPNSIACLVMSMFLLRRNRSNTL